MKTYRISTFARITCAAALQSILLGAVSHAEPSLRVISVQPTAQFPNPSGIGYQVADVTVNGGSEYRCSLHGHHFLSIIRINGTYNLRPHPGVDVNGWGSSWYFQPFLPDAGPRAATVNAISTTGSGIDVSASGAVARGASGQFGTWSSTMHFTYDPLTKQIAGSGTYSITLAGALSPATGDLNLCRVASNALNQVPLLTGGPGNTGDMRDAVVTGHNFAFTWDPIAQPGHFPTDNTYNLSTSVVGEFNQVDTAAQGFCPIQAAYKPTMTVTFATADATVPMRFGGIYTTAQAQNFAADNVGITPIVFRSAPQTQFLFNVTFASSALPRDGVGVNLALVGELPEAGSSNVDIFYSPDLIDGFRRQVGSLPQTSLGRYEGTIRVPYLPQGVLPDRGFFIAKPPCVVQR